MAKNIGLFLVIFYASASFGVSVFGDLFEGLQHSASYKSSIPCASSQKKDCSIAQGLMGKALDTASDAGLDIKSVQVNNSTKETPLLFVKTKKSGICHVDLGSGEEAGGLKFSCSYKDLKNNKLQSIDKVVVLKKESKDNFILEDVTQEENITR